MSEIKFRVLYLQPKDQDGCRIQAMSEPLAMADACRLHSQLTSQGGLAVIAPATKSNRRLWNCAAENGVVQLYRDDIEILESLPAMTLADPTATTDYRGDIETLESFLPGPAAQNGQPAAAGHSQTGLGWIGRLIAWFLWGQA